MPHETSDLAASQSEHCLELGQATSTPAALISFVSTSSSSLQPYFIAMLSPLLPPTTVYPSAEVTDHPLQQDATALTVPFEQLIQTPAIHSTTTASSYTLVSSLAAISFFVASAAQETKMQRFRHNIKCPPC